MLCNRPVRVWNSKRLKHYNPFLFWKRTRMCLLAAKVREACCAHLAWRGTAFNFLIQIVPELSQYHSTLKSHLSRSSPPLWVRILSPRFELSWNSTLYVKKYDKTSWRGEGVRSRTAEKAIKKHQLTVKVCANFGHYPSCVHSQSIQIGVSLEWWRHSSVFHYVGSQ